MPKLTVVPASVPPPEERVRRRVRRMPRPGRVLQCNRCGGREVIETKVGVECVDGKTRGGTKQMICALCFLKGERVVL